MATSNSNVPREPSAYRPSIHFPERFHDRYEDERPPRHLDDEIVRGCIEDGEMRRPAGSSVVLFRERFGGVDYRLVASLAKQEVVTGYPVEIHTDEARESGRWTKQQIEDIRRFIATDPSSDVDGSEYVY